MSGVFVPAVIAIAVLTVIGWLAAGETYGFALARGISVLVISCPCALGWPRRWLSWWATDWVRKTGSCLKRRVSLEETGEDRDRGPG